MTRASAATAAFLAARDLLLRHRTDYDTAVREFRWPAVDRFNWTLDYFDVIASGNNAPALHVLEEDGSDTIRSFAEMSGLSNRVANFLRSLGARRGDRLMLMLGNEAPLWETFLACIKLGVVVSPATTLLTPEDLEDRVARGDIRFVVAACVDKLHDIPAALTKVSVGGPAPGWHAYDAALQADASFTPDGATRASDPMMLYFTSGTTAKPKLVMHTHQSYPIGHLSTMYWLGLEPGDRHWNISSPGWAKHAWSCLFAPWNAAATVFVYNYARFQSKAVLETLVRQQVTTLCAPPTVWRMLVQERLTNYPVVLRELGSAGEPLNPEVIDQVRRAWNITIRDGYGQTETTAIVANSPGQAVKPGSMGRPMVGYPVVLLDLDNQPVDEGELCLDLRERPVGLTDGYADDESATAQATRDGFYRTGDIACRDEDGYLTYVGRTDDVFKASGYRISPFELESALIEHPAIAEAAVVPSPDSIRSAVPKGFVMLTAGYEPGRELAADIFRFLRTTIAPYKRIRRLEFANLPKTISGKIRRIELRAAEADRRARGDRSDMEFWEEDFTGS